jgi:protein arginine N-methyltransferase 2
MCDRPIKNANLKELTKNKKVNMEYFKQKLTYTEEGELLDDHGNAIMMEWERPIMKEQAKTTTSKGGRVLNIGFGMGIIDSYIAEADGVTEHWIIEPHPDVQREMMKRGWLTKANCIFTTWQEALPYLPQFDGIYIDTWCESLVPFYRAVKNILKPDGVFTFFNNPRSDEKGLHMIDEEYYALKQWADVKFESFEIPSIAKPIEQRPDGLVYWDTEQKTYWNPIVTHTKNKYYE